VSAHHVQVIPVFVVHLNIALLMENVNNVMTTATVELLLLTAKVMFVLHVQVILTFVYPNLELQIHSVLLMENVNNVLTTATVELLLLTAKAIPALRVQFLLPFAHQNIQIRLNNVRLMEVVFVVQQMLIAQERILLTAKITSATHV